VRFRRGLSWSSGGDFLASLLEAARISCDILCTGGEFQIRIVCTLPSE